MEAEAAESESTDETTTESTETTTETTETSSCTPDNASDEEETYVGLFVTWEFTERFIGFSATTSKGAGQNEVANIRYLKPLTDKNNMCRETEEDYFEEYWIGEDSPDTIVDESESESCDSE